MVERSHNLIETTATVLSVSEGVVWTGVMIAIVLLLFSAGIVLNVLLISREKKVSFGDAMSHALSAIWAIPVVVVVACFGFRAVNHFQTSGEQSITRDNAESHTVDNAESQETREKETRVQNGRAKPKFHATTVSPPWKDDPGVISERGASVALAEQKLFEHVRRRFRQSASASDEPPLFATAWSSGPSLDRAIREHAVLQSAVQEGVEKIRVSRPGESPREYTNAAFQVFWKIDDSSRVQARVREESATLRIWLLGGFLALLTLIVAAIAAYLRLDARTKGRFRFRLKLAATALIVAGGLLLTALIPVT